MRTQLVLPVQKECSWGGRIADALTYWKQAALPRELMLRRVPLTWSAWPGLSTPLPKQEASSQFPAELLTEGTLEQMRILSENRSSLGPTEMLTLILLNTAEGR